MAWEASVGVLRTPDANSVYVMRNERNNGVGGWGITKMSPLCGFEWYDIVKHGLAPVPIKMSPLCGSGRWLCEYYFLFIGLFCLRGRRVLQNLKIQQT